MNVCRCGREVSRVASESAENARQAQERYPLYFNPTLGLPSGVVSAWLVIWLRPARLSVMVASRRIEINRILDVIRPVLRANQLVGFERCLFEAARQVEQWPLVLRGGMRCARWPRAHAINR